MSELKLEFSDQNESKDAAELLGKLSKEVSSSFGPAERRELTISIKDSHGQMIAGLNGSTSWRWFYVKLLWVSDDHRGRGLGSQLLKEAEAEARRRNAVGIWLDTFDPQTVIFYKKMGFEVSGSISDFPPGYHRYFLIRKFV